MARGVSYWSVFSLNSYTTSIFLINKKIFSISIGRKKEKTSNCVRQTIQIWITNYLWKEAWLLRYGFNRFNVVKNHMIEGLREICETYSENVKGNIWLLEKLTWFKALESQRDIICFPRLLFVIIHIKHVLQWPSKRLSW